MPRPSEIAADARALYGPLDQRPSAQEAGDGALWVAPQASHALYHVQSGNWVRIGEGTAAPAAPAGVPVLYGPYVVDYTDVPHDADTKTLWTPAIGDVLLKLTTDGATEQPWDHGQLFIGQNVDGTVDPPHNVIGGAVSFPSPGPPDSTWANADPGWSGAFYDASGGIKNGTAYVFHGTDPVRVQLALTGGADPTQGHVELYALVARAIAP